MKILCFEIIILTTSTYEYTSNADTLKLRIRIFYTFNSSSVYTSSS